MFIYNLFIGRTIVRMRLDILANDVRTKTADSMHYRYMLLTIPRGTALLHSRYIERRRRVAYRIFRRVPVENVSDQKYPIFGDRVIAFRVGVETTLRVPDVISLYKILLLIYIKKTSYNIIICMDGCAYIGDDVYSRESNEYSGYWIMWTLSEFNKSRRIKVNLKGKPCKWYGVQK